MGKRRFLVGRCPYGVVECRLRESEGVVLGFEVFGGRFAVLGAGGQRIRVGGVAHDGLPIMVRADVQHASGSQGDIELGEESMIL